MESSSINHQQCRTFVSEIFVRCGLAEVLARQWSDLLVETSLMGIDSHGIRMLNRYVKHMQGGGIATSFKPLVLKDRAAMAVVDAQGSAGHLAASHAMRIAIEKAQHTGVGLVSIIGTNHVGACALYAAQASCMGLCTAVSRPGIAPWGGKQALLGLNPVAIGFPIAHRAPFLLDMSTTVTAMGKITRAADEGQPIPKGWALDEDGQPTTNPERARRGSLLPIGRHKGCGLAMAIEAITALLPGGNLSTSVLSWIAQTAKPMDASFTAIALDISAFTEPETFAQQAAAWVESITTSPRRVGVDQIYYPGQKAGATRQERLTSGIPLDDYTRQMLARLAHEFSIEPLTP